VLTLREVVVTTAQTSKVALADIQPNRRRGGELRVVLGPATVGATTGFLGVLALRPGEFVNEHYHPYSEEFLFTLSGSVLVMVDGDPVRLGPREGLVIPRNARHRVSNEGAEPAECVFHLCPLAPRPELGHVDTEPQPGAAAEPQAVQDGSRGE
jgi:putative monooxygenase